MAIYEREKLRIVTDDQDNAVEVEIKNPGKLNKKFLLGIVSNSIFNSEPPRELVVQYPNKQPDYILHDTLKNSKLYFSEKELTDFIQNITDYIQNSDRVILRNPQAKPNP